eukprot:464889_1
MSETVRIISECSNLKCEHLNRLLQTETFYQTLDIVNNSSDKHKFIKYVYGEKTQKTLLNDFIHILTAHTDISDITRHLTTKCNFQNCVLLQRHFRDRSKNIKSEYYKNEEMSNEEWLFYLDIMDSFHCHIYHIYDIGMRINLNNTDDIKQNDENKTDHTYCIDHEFEKKQKIINNKRDALIKLDKENRLHFDKFNIETTNVNASDIYDITSETTFIDGLYEYM